MPNNQAPAKRASFSAVAARLRDPLLAATYAATLLGMTATVILTVISIGTSLLIWLIRSRVSAAMAGIQYVDATRMPYLISLNLLLVAVMAVIGFFFLGQLRQLIKGVAEGNPFGEDNARRLTLMAWLTVPANVLAMNVGSFGTWFTVLTHAQTPGFGASPQNFAFNPSAWLLTLVLFILARVFKQGTSLQSDLEGTV